MKLLENRTAVITGATRGIGKGIAQRFAQQGANVIFTYVSESSSKIALDLVEELTKQGIKAKGFRVDASKFEDSQNMIDEVVSEFGGVDILVNNAGITQDTLLMRMTKEQWDKVIDVNLSSVFNMTKAVQKSMLQKRNGSIINLSSVVGVRGNAGQANYSASKAGVIGFTKSVALELGSRNIRSNAIAPGFISTEMTGKLDPETLQKWVKDIPLKREGTTSDVADVALFLASDMSKYVTGQVIHVCGGMLT
ncbi:3-oxoacyl-[acyl-carrier-protein] reductase [Ichthyobacterium seriolicida]|uniref:3-oxoacyl-[acyl-carrier-protein] reductase n=1 Tax=Ichthyobacterium seriolicida TaxID=242600 RepID=A0A1J1E423_9FLAO|nr:3-oxoacyl-[acyl-carrier-protein] reductase [Ichthyobacterium seriolicida]BAV94070.1 3-oxoacyl-[acyl-carrier protein] reductase [Ichthyobacterium seriolicida]